MINVLPLTWERHVAFSNLRFFSRSFLRILHVCVLITLVGHAFAQETSQTSTPSPSQSTNISDSAVVFMYHRFGEDRIPTTNTPVDQFVSHLETIEAGKHPVLSLSELLDLYDANEPVPERAIVLTVDDAFRSVYEVAWPLLKDRGYRFTLFVATDHVDRATREPNLSNYMTWDMVRDLHENGVEIANHTASHLHMPLVSMDRNREEITKSQQRFQEELGFQPDVFAYPYGEYSRDVRQMIIDLGFRAAFGQHSGVTYAGADRFTLPRFALNEKHGDEKSFALRANALPLPVSDVIPLETVVSKDNNPPAFGFTVGARIQNPQRLSCYREGRLEITWLGEKRAEIRLEKPFRKGRTRINCTILSPQGRWRWFSQMFLVPR